MIDLHTHTTESDGSFEPGDLLDAAVRLGLEALAITDHDTFSGYDQVAARAVERGFDLVCGIELSTKFHGHSVHLLGYFLHGDPGPELRGWLDFLRVSRDRRNLQLVERLRALGIDITLEDVTRKSKHIPGRPHFAAVLIEKGYVKTVQEAFERYLGESAPAYTTREEPPFAEGVRRIVEAGGLPSLPHPKRVNRDRDTLEPLIKEMRDLGLPCIEVYHSDHSEDDIAWFLDLARRLALIPTGGSDFHGSVKPNVALGTGIDGRLRVPRRVLDDLRRR
jgi:predicted metal-dependent phosphoesterase TrpH